MTDYTIPFLICALAVAILWLAVKATDRIMHKRMQRRVDERARSARGGIVGEGWRPKRQPPTMPPRAPRSIASMPYGESKLQADPRIAQMLERQDVDRQLRAGAPIPAETVRRLGLLSPAMHYEDTTGCYRYTPSMVAREQTKQVIERQRPIPAVRDLERRACRPQHVEASGPTSTYHASDADPWMPLFISGVLMDPPRESGYSAPTPAAPDCSPPAPDIDFGTGGAGW